MNDMWYAHPDDLIGGWCIMNIDLPPSQTSGIRQIASVCDETVARHIASLHNTDLTFRIGL